MERAAIAELLMEYVRKNEILKIEAMLKNGDEASWRHIIRYEFKLEEIMTTILKYEILLPHLLSYEITSLSAFHLAALSGHNDVLITFIDHDIPIDIGLQSGTTALHLACLAGKPDTAEVLIDIYKAEVNRKDNYGWTAVHYAATEGHLDVLKVLVKLGADVTLRDKDGTAAAFRANVNGHSDVVSFLVEHGDAETLNVDDNDDDDNEQKRQSYHPLYASINELTKKRNRPAKPSTPARPAGLKLTDSDKTTVKRKSVDLAAVVPTPRISAQEKNTTLAQPRNTRNSEVRRLIRRELELVFRPEPEPESDYERPIDVQMRMKPEGSSMQGDDKLDGVRIDMITGIMREELEKYRHEISSSSSTATPMMSPTGAHGYAEVKKRVTSTIMEDNGAYEDLYACIRDLGPAPRIPEAEEYDSAEDDKTIAPPLPPRNTTLPHEAHQEAEASNDILTLSRPQVTSVELKESLQNIAPKLEGNWKKLAHALPLDSTPAKVESRIKYISEKYPGDRTKQAAIALGEWRLNMKNEADLSHLLEALRRCNLGEVIADIEVLTQEFSV